jgi:hypothetical protein
MANSRRKKSSVSVRISRPHITAQVPVARARTIAVHRQANRRLGTSTSHTLSSHHSHLTSPDDSNTITEPFDTEPFDYEETPASFGPAGESPEQVEEKTKRDAKEPPVS